MSYIHMSSSYDTLQRVLAILTKHGIVFGFLSILSKALPSPMNGTVFMIKKELENLLSSDPPQLSLKQRLRAYRNRFDSRDYIAFGIKDSSDPDLYLSIFQIISYTYSINENPLFLDRKKEFHKYMEEKGFRHYLPSLFGVIENGVYKGEQNLDDLLQKERKLVLKSSRGGRGEGIYFYEKSNEDFIINREKKSKEEIDSIIKKLHDYLVTEYCKPADFLEEIYPHSANTARIWTISPDGEKPYIPVACLRIGTKKSGVTEHLHLGGLTAEIDLETGELSSAAEILSSGRVRWHEFHPNTNSKIKGVFIPGWKSFKNEFLNIVDELEGFKFVAWDILFTGEGNFTIIEGNNLPSPALHQVHRPLLKDDRLRKFLLENGVPV